MNPTTKNTTDMENDLFEFCKKFVSMAEEKLQVYEAILKHEDPNFVSAVLTGSAFGSQVNKEFVIILDCKFKYYFNFQIGWHW